MVRGLASCEGSVDCTPWLLSRKMLKFMGKQDQLAVTAASLALERAGLGPGCPGLGLYLVVGHIPFESDDMLPLARESSQDGTFSMERFSTIGLDQVNPLLTFRCLPNMPAFHCSLNLKIQGPSFTSFPGLGQFYLALEQAHWDLHEGRVETALVGAVADHNNFLVDYQRKRLGQTRHLPDLAAFLCLGREGPGPRLLEWRVHFDGQCGQETTAAELVLTLERGQREQDWHTLDGYHCFSRWSET